MADDFGMHMTRWPDNPVSMETPRSGALAGSILKEAAGIVEGARNQTHGHKERSFQAIADLWNAYLGIRANPDAAISPHDVSVLMMLMKIARSEQGQAIRDHYVDAAGYAAIAGELAKVT